MSTLEERLAKLQRFNAALRATDPQLTEEALDVVGQPEVLTEAVPERVVPASTDAAIELESIVLRRTRPVLAIRNHQAVLEWVDEADSAIWKSRLVAAASHLEKAARAVGRINLEGAPLDWVGTGWLVADNILATNRHVAQEFVTRRGAGFQFLMGATGPIRPSIDFLQEIDNAARLAFGLVRALHIENAQGPDVAFFEVEPIGADASLARPIELAPAIEITENAATIGYPAYDSRIPEPELMERIYGRIYNKKRLAPGGVTRVEATWILHNCTTLGGNSGSAVVSLDSGKALGLHFSGSFLETNYAVRADVVRRLLKDVRSGRTLSVPSARPRPKAVGGESSAAGALSTTLNIPLTITVSFGKAGGIGSLAVMTPDWSAHAPDEEDEVSEEARPEDYRDREGYLETFLGTRFAVPLPSVERDADDMVEFQVDGHPETVLKYQNFSVVMSRSRRLCLLSAVNIDGGLSKKSKRVGWKLDPRIPKALQIRNECYGDPPKFSRGHMTRREDPAWGSPAAARRGNEDSMHVTNATPQMQAFNSPIWLALEDYALGHAREDDMKICVFTGPYLNEDDPVRFGVRIPLRFWKIIAFIHDETGELCATGYEMGQERSLPPSEEEFVFGQFTSPQLGITTQVPIRSIEEKSGLSFGVLGDVDPLGSVDESASPGGPAFALATLEQIRFTT